MGNLVQWMPSRVLKFGANQTHIPSLSEYEDWCARSNMAHSRNAIPAPLLRRMVIMRRELRPWKTIRDALGVHGRAAYDKLPEHLK